MKDWFLFDYILQGISSWDPCLELPSYPTWKPYNSTIDREHIYPSSYWSYGPMGICIVLWHHMPIDPPEVTPVPPPDPMGTVTDWWQKIQCFLPTGKSKFPSNYSTGCCNPYRHQSSYFQLMIGMSNHILSRVFGFHEPILSFGEPGSLGNDFYHIVVFHGWIWRFTVKSRMVEIEDLRAWQGKDELVLLDNDTGIRGVGLMTRCWFFILIIVGWCSVVGCCPRRGCCCCCCCKWYKLPVVSNNVVVLLSTLAVFLMFHRWCWDSSWIQ